MAFETEVADLIAANTRLNKLRQVVQAVKTHCNDMLAETTGYVTQAAEYRAIAEKNGIPVTPPNSGTTYRIKGFVAEGDSITSGTPNSPNPWPAQVAALTGLPVLNLGQSSTTLNQMKDNYGGNDHAGTKFDPNMYDAMIIGSAGTNDFTQDNVSLASLKSYIQTFCAKGRATGYKVYVGTLTPRQVGGTYTSSHESIRLEYNAWLRANYASFCDGIIDFASVLVLSDMFDGIHPSDDPGSKKMAAAVQAFLTVSSGGGTGNTGGNTGAASEITTNGVIDEAKWLTMANKMWSEDAIAYRYGAPSPTGQTDFPTWFQPGNHPWPQDIVGNHSGEWQLGTFRTYDGYFQGGDFASNCLHLLYVADDPNARIGVAALQSTSTDHGTFTQKPELPWVYYGRGLDAVETVYWKESQGKVVQKPVCSANALGRPGWAVTTITCFQNGFMATAGFNTMQNKASCQLAPGMVPTAIALTSANEFALVTCWDTNNKRGVLAIVSLCGLGHNATIANPNSGEPNGWWGEWNEPHPGLHNLGNLVFMKPIGYMPLPGMMAPTEVSCTTGHSRFGYLDGSPGEPSCGNQNFSNESLRQNFLPGKPLERAYAKQGEAIIISKTEKKALFIDLKPLFTYINSMYFSTDRNKYLQTTNIGQNAGQWPFTFSEAPSQTPVVTKTVLLDDEPTCVFVYPYAKKEEWRQALIGSKNGKVRIYNLGGVSETGNAAAKVEVGSFNVGLNPTSVTWIKEKARDTTQRALVPEHTRQFVFCVRGERCIKWYDLTSTTTAVLRRTFRDTRVIDPICVVDTDNHGGEHYVVNVADFSGRCVHGVRWGEMIMWTYPEQSRFKMGATGNDEFEYCGNFGLPGKPFRPTTANVS